MHRYFFDIDTFSLSSWRISFGFSCQRVGKLVFTQRAQPKMLTCTKNTMPNFRANEWENLFSHNERSRKCGIYEVNAELAQLVEQLIRNE